MVRIGSARSNESGGINGGKPGDQKGGAEVSIQDWYLHQKGWIVIRAKDTEIREKIARNMEAACKNDYIGYCQDHRTTATKAAEPYAYDLSKVSTQVEVDCSELVRICCLYAGITVSSFSTSNEVEVLDDTGYFDILEDKEHCTSPDKLLRGDILVTKTKGHTVVALNNGVKAEVKTKGWEKDKDKRYKYRGSNGNYVMNDWKIINHHWYLFDADGYMMTGWQKWNTETKMVNPPDGSGDWYYLDETKNGPLEGACWHSRENGAMEIWYI